MKKIAIASLIALAATAASALEIGTSMTRDYSGAVAQNGGGITIGKSYGKVSVTAGFDRFTQSTNDQDRYSLVAGYDVAKLGTVNLAVKTGVAYLNNQTGANGYAMTVGTGVSLPLTKQVSVGLDVARQYGQDRVKSSDGNTVTAGVSYRF